MTFNVDFLNYNFYVELANLKKKLSRQVIKFIFCFAEIIKMYWKFSCLLFVALFALSYGNFDEGGSCFAAPKGKKQQFLINLYF